ncbi:MAG TPA: hypothetical protein VNS53_01215 [Sphingomicrobium sp.]|jgi:hypothetical protein|nr:hypothetical protein [Sphingomicrobium sp.]
MIDEIFDRTYQSGRAQLNAGLGLLFREIGNAAGNAFHVLNRIEYEAPWLARRRRRRSA